MITKAISEQIAGINKCTDEIKQIIDAMAVTHAAMTISGVLDDMDNWDLGIEPEFINEIVSRFTGGKNDVR